MASNPTATIKNWAEFQHYKDRSPPWLKLHRGLLDDFDFQRLPVASRALAPMLWLLASESGDGSVTIDPERLAFRLRCTVAEAKEGLTPLISGGFLVVASGVLAECLQDACLEGETETETEGEGGASATAPAVPKKRDQTITEWLDTVEGDAIPADDPVFDYATKAGIPHDFLALAWLEFVARHEESGKRYKDFRAVFRKVVRENWYKLWWDSAEAGYALTTAGKQAQRVAA